MESKFIPMLVAMHDRGVRVDLDAAERLNKQLAREERIVARKIYDLCGMNLSVWAAHDVARAFDALGLEYPKTEKTEVPSFRAQWLEHYDHPIAGLIRRARWLDKMRTAAVLKGVVETLMGRKDLRLWAKDGFKETPSEKRQTRADGRRADRETLKSNDNFSNFQSVEIFRINVQEMSS